jgi:hypothetical protein
MAFSYGYAYFSPTIIAGYGYSAIQTQLHSVPPWAAAFCFSMTVAYASDKARHRYGFVLLALAVTIAGFGMLLGIHNNTHVQYGGLFLVAAGAYTAMPLIVCTFNMNLGGHHRRAIATAWQIGFGNTGGIIAVYAFLKQDAPKYITGYSICLAFAVLSLIAHSTYSFLCIMQNRHRQKAVRSVLTESERAELGDLSPDYRYMI